MSIWQRIYGATPGGWKTWGPNAYAGDGAFAAYGPDECAPTALTALTLSAVWACQNLRAETLGTMPLHLRDKNKNILKDHPLYEVLHTSPNADQTAAEYWSQQIAHEDMHGNGISIIERRSNKSVISLVPVDPMICGDDERKSGQRFYRIGSERYSADDILHFKGFSLNGMWGLPRLDIGRQIINAQLSANGAALTAFKQGLKVGGFFQMDRDLDDTANKKLQERLEYFGRSENAGRFMALLKGMTPIEGSKFRIKPVEAELLQSRYFGIEEVCRLYACPPPLIGHADKASSWASSLEMLDLFFLTYSIMPSAARKEQAIVKKLLTPQDRANGVEAKFLIDAIRRADLATRQSFYESGLQNGYLNPDEVRDMEERGSIPNGSEYRVGLNMGTATGNQPQPQQGSNKK